MTPCRLYVDPPAYGAWNMAVDEVLLEDATDRGLASVRFYQWREPTLSLGYFQRYDDRDQHSASRNATVVRRLSGGGALLHDRELTYSLALPSSHLLAKEPGELYAVVHSALIAVLGECGVQASLQRELSPVDPVSARGEEPFLCFARRTARDVVVPATPTQGAAKIAGSAQRRRRGAVLQHGAVLLDASGCAPELPGISQVASASVSPGDLIDPWRVRLAAALKLQLAKAQSLSAESCLRCNGHAAKFASPSWTRRR